MKILAIRGENLASLPSFDIDFTKEPLASAGIFAITGPTGAGKSTLLDALCLALFADTPRLSQVKDASVRIAEVKEDISQGDARLVLRRGTGAGYAEVDFVGIDGRAYRAKYTIRRAFNKSDHKFQASEHRITDLHTQAPLAGLKTEARSEIQRLVGLSLEQFTRSVLLAQGDFTAFLKANEKEKAEILESLTGTSEYTAISAAIYEKHKRLSEEYKLQAEQIKHLSILDADGLAQLEQDLNNVTEQLQTAMQAKAESEKILAWHTRHQDLQAKVAQAQRNFEDAQALRAQLDSRRAQLQQVEMAQEARPMAEMLAHTQQELARWQAQLADFEAQKAIAEGRGQQALQQQEAASQATKDFDAKKAVLVPKISKAQQLDALLLSKKQDVDERRQTASQRVATSAKIQEKLEAIQKELQEIQQNLAENKAWREKFSHKQAVAEQEGLIVDRLQVAQRLLGAQKARLAEMAKHEQEIQQHQAQLASCQSTAQAFMARQEPLRLEIARLQQQASPFEQMSASEETARQAYMATAEAQKAWLAYSSVQQELAKLQQSAIENDKMLAVHRASFRKAEQEWMAQQTVEAQAQKSLETAKQAASKEVTHLRAQLQAGEPCPVCGATEHPFAQAEKAFDAIVQALEEEWRKQQKKSKLLQAKQEEVKLQIAAKEASMQEAELRKQDLAPKAQQLKEAWTQHETIALQVAPEKRQLWFEEELETLRHAWQQFEKSRKAAEQAKELLSKLEKKQQELLQEIADIQQKQQEWQHRIALSEQQLSQTKALQAKEEAELNSAIRALHGYFGSSQWESSWREDAARMLKQVQEFALQWRRKLEDASKLQQDWAQATQSQQHTEQQAIEAQAQAVQAQASFDSAKNALQQLQQERNALFAESASEYLQRLEAEEKQCKVREQEANARLQGMKEEASALAGKAQELRKQLAAKQEEKESQHQKLANWLASKGLTAEALSALLKYGQAWISQEREAIMHAEKRSLDAQASLQAQQQELSAHGVPPAIAPTAADAQSLLQASTAQADELQQRRTEWLVKQKQDQENRAKAGHLQEALDKQKQIVDTWDVLNKEIGSADGAKFRKIAQEYTLDMLLGYANVHLEDLNPRYMLARIPDTLGLQIIDRDMGGEIRTIHSLSGGESFLVSLALALGLSSLSSKRMHVESLFIDEGFGTLDPATLSVAIDALERLQSQGRKVGVISHVQEMTERIQVKIAVRRKAGSAGESEVVVLGV